MHKILACSGLDPAVFINTEQIVGFNGMGNDRDDSVLGMVRLSPFFFFYYFSPHLTFPKIILRGNGYLQGCELSEQSKFQSHYPCYRVKLVK